MTRKIGKELVARLKHMNDSFMPITPSESESPQPVAWVAFADDGSESGVTALNREAVEDVAAKFGWAVAPLYRSPACPYVTGTVTRYCTLTPLTLTDAEREAIEDAVQAGEFDAGLFDCEWARKHAATLRGLLERTAQTIK